MGIWNLGNVAQVLEAGMYLEQLPYATFPSIFNAN